MITLQESHFFLIMVLTSLITYILFSIFQSCDVHCKVNFYKYENHHATPKNKQKEPIIVQPDINKVLFNKSSNNSNNSYIGDKTSSHSSSIQGNDIDNSEDDEIINQLFGINNL
tara:strand:+ start:5478 stop:5819 length:342 start_codon:yes stop_codon:yes gene_type:complete